MSDIKRIYLNPGHDNRDPGAVGYEVERDLTVRVTKFTDQHLKNNYVCETRTNPGTMGSLTKIAEDANEWGADLMMSNHFNAGGGDGYESLVHSKANLDLGRIFEKHVKAAGQNSRGVKYRPDLGILRLTNMPAILNEGAFVDNWKDIKDWNDDAELKVLGKAYAEAAAEYLKLPKKKVSSRKDDDDFIVRVTIRDLYIRTGPGTKYKRKGFIKPGAYTVTDQQGRWGKLKSGAGWICLDYAERI